VVVFHPKWDRQCSGWSLRRRQKRLKEEAEKPSRRNKVWATDLKFVAVGERN